MQRLKSIDILRGAIVVLMAIDHVRLYGGIPAGGPTAALFFTRWITHFCVSGFVFFAGMGIFLYAQKLNDGKKLSGYLLKRGLLLVFLELVVIRFFWTFNLNLSAFMLFGVIWMLGCCMILMAALVKVPSKWLGIAGIVIILIQTIFHKLPFLFPVSMQEPVATFWNFFYPTPLGHNEIINILYVLIPWIGVMMTGYAFGNMLTSNPDRANRLCVIIGISCMLLFVIIGTILALREENKDNIPFIFRLLNQQKYPASALFLLMTLGPLITLIPYAARWKGWLANVLNVFGSVPLFYYLLHILLIHISAITVNLIRTGLPHQDWYQFAPFYTTQPEEIRWPLWLLYLVFIIDVSMLFFACRWYANLKQKNPKPWMRYL